MPRVAPFVLPCLVALAVAAPRAYADDPVVTCSAAAGRVSVEVANPSGPPVMLGHAPTGEVTVDGVPCADATVANTDTVAVRVLSGSAGIDLTNGFGPGLTPETDGIGEIEVEWTGGDAFVVNGGPGEDDVRWAAGGLHLDGDTDTDLTFTGPVPVTYLLGNDGDDVLDASGAPEGVRVELGGGAGTDLLHGHDGEDRVTGGDGNDRVSDGTGADLVTGDGGDDVIAAGTSTFAGESAGPVAVPDKGFVTDSIPVPTLLREVDVEVRVTLAHTDVSAVTIQLTRSGARSLLSRGDGTSPGTAFHGTLFHDSGTRVATDADGVRTGRFRPWFDPLARVVSTTRVTTEPWVLSVTDNAADGRAGTLVGWSVHVVGTPRTRAGTEPSGDAADSYDGGAGNDTLSYATRNTALAFNTGFEWGPAGEAGENDTAHFRTFERYEGGFGDDTFVGSPRDEAFVAGQGADNIRGNGGSDVYDCGYSYPVDDVATFHEAAGPLRIDLAAGVVTGDGTDTISGCEQVYGTESGDEIVGSSANEFILGMGGDDTISSGQGNDRVYAGDGDDTLLEGAPYDLGNNGADVLHGDAGTDTVSYAGRYGRVVVSFDGAGDDGEPYPAERDLLAGLENAVGGRGDDLIAGDDAANVLDGGGGNDTITGGGGDDVLSGGDGDDRFVEGSAASGADVLSGGAGADTADYRGRTLALSIALDDAVGDGEAGENDDVRSDVENVWGGAAGDVLTGSGGSNRLLGYGGADLLTGGLGTDLLDGGDGGDVILAADAAFDTLVGGAGVDVGHRDATDAASGVEVLLP